MRVGILKSARLGDAEDHRQVDIAELFPRFGVSRLAEPQDEADSGFGPVVHNQRPER